VTVDQYRRIGWVIGTGLAWIMNALFYGFALYGAAHLLGVMP
jgi:hypothetical protein